MEKIQQQLENLEKGRSRWIFVNLIGFCVWDGMRILNNYFANPLELPVSTGIMILGWGIWILGLIQLFKVSAKAKQTKNAMGILNDELVQINRMKAWRLAFVVLCFSQVMVLLYSLAITNISSALSAEISIYIGVIAAIGGFLYFNNDPNE